MQLNAVDSASFHLFPCVSHCPIYFVCLFSVFVVFHFKISQWFFPCCLKDSLFLNSALVPQGTQIIITKILLLK